MNNCSSCQHYSVWKSSSGVEEGVCSNPKIRKLVLTDDGGFEILPPPDFGCAYHEEKTEQ